MTIVELNNSYKYLKYSGCYLGRRHMNRKVEKAGESSRCNKQEKKVNYY